MSTLGRCWECGNYSTALLEVAGRNFCDQTVACREAARLRHAEKSQEATMEPYYEKDAATGRVSVMRCTTCRATITDSPRFYAHQPYCVKAACMAAGRAEQERQIKAGILDANGYVVAMKKPARSVGLIDKAARPAGEAARAPAPAAPPPAPPRFDPWGSCRRAHGRPEPPSGETAKAIDPMGSLRRAS